MAIRAPDGANKKEKEMLNPVHDCLQCDQLFQLNWMMSNSTQTLSHGSLIAKQNDSSSREIYHNFTGDFYLSHQKHCHRVVNVGARNY